MQIQLTGMSALAILIPLSFLAIIGLIDLLQKFGYLIPKSKQDQERKEEEAKKEFDRNFIGLLRDVMEVKNGIDAYDVARKELERDLSGLIERVAFFHESVTKGLMLVVSKQEEVNNNLRDRQEANNQSALAKIEELFRRSLQRVDDSILQVKNASGDMVSYKGALDEIRSSVNVMKGAIANHKHRALIEKSLQVTEKIENGVNSLLRLHPAPKEFEGDLPRHFCNVYSLTPKVDHILHSLDGFLKKMDDARDQWEKVPESLRSLSENQKDWYEHVLQQGREIIKLFRAMASAWEREEDREG